MKIFSLRGSVLSLLAIGLILLTADRSFAQSLETIETKAGELTLTRDENLLFQVKFDNRVLYESQVETGEIVAAYPKLNPTLVVLSIGEGALACATHFYIVDVSKKKPAITDAFGNCNPAPKIVFQNQALTIKFPDGRRDQGAYKYGKAETWQYGRGRLRKINSDSLKR